VAANIRFQAAKMGYVEHAGHGSAARFWLLATLCSTLALGASSVAAAAPVSPLPESDYRMHSACAAPAPGRAGCMALELVAQSAAAQAQAQAGTGSVWTGLESAAECSAEFPSACLTPMDLRSAYFPGEEAKAPTSSPQTIALIDAYNDPKAEADLNVYGNAFGLPPIHKCSGNESDCFEQVSQTGTSELPFPKTETEREAKETVCLTTKAKENKRELERREAACTELVEAEGWAVETSTDIEMARAVCQNCKILLLEANDPPYEHLEAAENTAVELGATEVSNSWGGPQNGSNGDAFDHPGTVITASAGDYGYLNWTEAQAAENAKQEGKETGYFAGADYPAASPDVVAVGGTKLTMSNGVRRSESVWNDDPSPQGTDQGAGGGGCSLSFTAKPWQQAVPDWAQVGCGSKRAVADVSADADPYTGVAVYDSEPSIQEEASGELFNAPLEWWPIGGTSVASPIIASMFALAGGSHEVPYPTETLYSHLETTGLYNVTKGGNGRCDDLYASCAGSLEPLSPEFAFDCGEGSLICNAAPGCGDEYYDGPTGVGAPAGIEAFKPGAIAPLAKPECPTKSEPGKEKSKSEGSGANNGSGTTTPGSGSDGEQEEPNGKTSEAGYTGPQTATGLTGGATPLTTKPGPSPSGTATQAPRITALKLTSNAHAALHSDRVPVAQVAFSCTLSRGANVRVTLAIQIRSSGSTHWRTLHSSFTFAATRGVNRRRLHGSGTLTPGIYRLTLTPAAGTPRTLTIRVP
jgi:hypothetical protein